LCFSYILASPEVDENSSPSPSPTTRKNFGFKHREGEVRKSPAMRLSPSEIPSTDSDTEKARPKIDSKGPGKMHLPSRVDVESSSNFDTTKHRVSSSSEQEYKSELSTAKARKASAPSSQGHASLMAANPEKSSHLSTQEAKDFFVSMKNSDQEKSGKEQASTEWSVSNLKDLEASTGKILVKVWHSEGRLHVKVIEGCGISSREDGQPPYSCVMVQLLPDKQCKRSAIQSSTTDPEFNAVFTVSGGVAIS